MNILVCVKQVPDAGEVKEIKIDPATNALAKDSAPNIVNTLDTYALETAVKIKDADADTKVFAVSMGAETAKEALKACLSVGADRAYQITDDALTGSDTLATSYVLSRAVKTIEARENITFDLILCGKQALDGDTAQVGPQLAEMLGYPQITSALEVSFEAGKVRVRRESEDGREVQDAALPAVVTVSKPDYEPRYASVKSKMAANRAEIPLLKLADLEADASRVGAAGSAAKVIKAFVPQRTKNGIKIQEETAELAADKLTSLLSDAGII